MCPVFASVVAAAQLLGVHGCGRQAAEQVPVERPVRGQRHLGHELDAIVGDDAHCRDELERRALVIAHGTREGEQLVVRAGPRRNRRAVTISVRFAERRREPECTFVHRVVGELHHRRDLLVRRDGVGGRVTHDDAPQRRMAHEEAGVHAQASLEPVEELAEGAPVPCGPALERRQRNAFDAGHHAHHVVDIAPMDLGDAEGCDREPAVAPEHRCHPVQRRRRAIGIPQRLRVVVRVHVDEPGRHDLPGHIDGSHRGVVDVPDRDDAPVTDADVGAPPGCAGAVDHIATGEHQIEHHLLPRRRPAAYAASRIPARQTGPHPFWRIPPPVLASVRR